MATPGRAQALKKEREGEEGGEEEGGEEDEEASCVVVTIYGLYYFSLHFIKLLFNIIF